ncbi:MAG: hypothetical protein ACPHCN_13345 [Mycobacterium sp.]
MIRVRAADGRIRRTFDRNGESVASIAAFRFGAGIMMLNRIWTLYEPNHLTDQAQFPEKLDLCCRSGWRSGILGLRPRGTRGSDSRDSARCGGFVAKGFLPVPPWQRGNLQNLIPRIPDLSISMRRAG